MEIPPEGASDRANKFLMIGVPVAAVTLLSLMFIALAQGDPSQPNDPIAAPSEPLDAPDVPEQGAAMAFDEPAQDTDLTAEPGPQQDDAPKRVNIRVDFERRDRQGALLINNRTSGRRPPATTTCRRNNPRCCACCSMATTT